MESAERAKQKESLFGPTTTKPETRGAEFQSQARAKRALESGRETPSKRHETRGVVIRTWWYITPVGDAPLASRLMISSYVIWGECCPICCGWWTAQGARSVALLQA